MCIRHISYRLKRRQHEQIKLLETATRYICQFSSQSKEAAELASSLEFIASDTEAAPQQPERRVILSPGAQRALERENQVKPRTLEATVEELPDAENRSVSPVPLEKMASSDSAMAFFTGGVNKGSV